MKKKKIGRPKMASNQKRKLFAVTLPPDLWAKVQKIQDKSKLIEALLLKHFS